VVYDVDDIVTSIEIGAPAMPTQAKDKSVKGPKGVSRSGLILVRLELPRELHDKFRVEAARECLPMSAMARQLVEDWVAERTAK
jgi:hypothetical protein